MSAATEDARLATFNEHRPYLFAVAYRMLGIAEDAEDILQDTWLRFGGARPAELENPRAYLVTIVTRLCLDLLRSARRQREDYVGTWLPEPVPSNVALPDELAERAESASFAFLLLVERLNPVERAILVLHDVFDYTHNEIAEVIGRAPAASRQSLRRARLKLGGATVPSHEAGEDAQLLVSTFLRAARDGDVNALVEALAADVVLMSDGGGKAQSISRPLAGRTEVQRFFVAISRADPTATVTPTQLNGQPAVLVHQSGELTTAFVFDITAQGITAIYAVRNPDKLRRLASTADR